MSSGGSGPLTRSPAGRASASAPYFRHFPTKQLLVEATIVRHLALLTDTARARGEHDEAGPAVRTTFREMVSDAPAKLALVAPLDDTADGGGFTEELQAAAGAPRDAVAVLLAGGQAAGDVHTDATVDEVYMLIGALADTRGDPAVLGQGGRHRPGQALGPATRFGTPCGLVGGWVRGQRTATSDTVAPSAGVLVQAATAASTVREVCTR